MKYITKYRSPNYNSRGNSKIKLIIIHYTALPNHQHAISHLCKKEKKVSAHYLISQDGIVYTLVNDKFRAWHAGQAYWQGIIDINSVSIGIELEGTDNSEFTDQQYNCLMKITKSLLLNYPNLCKERIVGHSTIAPNRKTDPGPFFNWLKLLDNL